MPNSHASSEVSNENLSNFNTSEAEGSDSV